MDTETEQARAALDRARADHARALLAVKDAPGDAQAQRRMQDAVRDGRRTWKAYQTAATAGLAAQIEAIIPSAFREVGPGPE